MSHRKPRYNLRIERGLQLGLTTAWDDIRGQIDEKNANKHDVADIKAAQQWLDSLKRFHIYQAEVRKRAIKSRSDANARRRGKGGIR